MKKIIVIVVVSLLLGAGISLAEEMDHSAHKGDMIRHTKIDGYGFMYHLIDMSEHLKHMPEMKTTHHLMVYVKDPAGQTVEKATVGYLVRGPDGIKQKAMAMGMSGGFGADIDLGVKGTYTIKTKVVDGESVLMDQFDYKME